MRAEVEAVASAGRAVSADEFDAVTTRITAASTAFRDAIEIAQAGV